MATAKPRAADQYRRQQNLTRQYALLAQQLRTDPEGGGPMTAVDGPHSSISDDLLRLIFTTSSPAR